MDEDDQADSGISPETTNPKHSKRNRLKGALSRTKSKFKKENERPKEKDLPDDVNEFLSAGRLSTSSRASAGDSLQHQPAVTSTDEHSSSPSSARPSTSESFTNPFAPQRSPRKVSVPKIDVSNSQRWPRAQPIGTTEQDINDFLRPEYQGRSQSATSFSNKPKKERRGRGLSVSFIEAPPVVIGEGGDDAPTPPVEISKAKLRARSVSPMPNRSLMQPDSAMNGTYGKRPSPIPPPPLQRPTHAPPDVLRPRMLQRVQTGMSERSPVGGSALDKEFEMTLRQGPNATNSPASEGGSTPNTPEILAPRPVRVVKPPQPEVLEEPVESHSIKKGTPSTSLRKEFRGGDALRMHLDKEAPDVVEDMREGRPLRRDHVGAKQGASNLI